MPQAAFIYNATVRENILFGLPFEESRYQKAVEAAALGPDLAMLPGAPSSLCENTERQACVVLLRCQCPDDEFPHVVEDGSVPCATI